jgi:hypothetical protein
MSKPSQDVVDKANKLWPLSRYDKEGRAKFDKLSKAKLQVSDSKFKQWNPLDQYLVLTHFPEMRKQFGRQERDRVNEEDEQNVAEMAREARLAKLAERKAQSDSLSENHSDETYQRQEVINVNLVHSVLFKYNFDWIFSYKRNVLFQITEDRDGRAEPAAEDDHDHDDR